MRGRTDACDASCLSECPTALGMDAAPCDPRGTHSDLSLAAAAVEYFGIEGVGMSSITVRRKLQLVVVAVVRSCITKGDHHAPLQRRLFSPPSTPPPPRVTKKRSVQSTSPLLRVAFPLLLATDIQIKEPPSRTYPASTLSARPKAEENVSNAFQIHATSCDEI